MDNIIELGKSPQNPSWITIGAFDSIHRGHQALLNRLVAGAHQQGCSAVAITFDPLPGAYLN